MSSAHCYDPNEEAKLRSVISSVGDDIFEGRVHVLAKAAIAKLQAMRAAESVPKAGRFALANSLRHVTSVLSHSSSKSSITSTVRSQVRACKKEQEEAQPFDSLFAVPQGDV